MEFHEKLQALRQKQGMTQEELAQALFVSRAAISKWESGRGYPNIDSLKAIAKFFSTTVDALLSGEEVLTIAEQTQQKRDGQLRDLILGLLDVSVSMVYLLPFFGQTAAGEVQAVSLLSLTEPAPYLRGAYHLTVIAIILCGIGTLALQNCQFPFWLCQKRRISLTLNTLGVLLFIVSTQPYAAVLLFIFLAIKVLILMKKP